MRVGGRLAVAAVFVFVAAVDVAQGGNRVVDLTSDRADWTVWGDEEFGVLGESVMADDVNGDGVIDVLAGQGRWTDPVAGAAAGRVVAWLGPLVFPSELDLAVDVPSFQIRGDFSNQRLVLLSDASDVDADGIADVIVGSLSGGPGGGRVRAGSVAVFRGRPTWPPVLRWSDADWVFHGADPEDALTRAAIGDVNGDGIPDIALATVNGCGPGNARTGAGEVYLLLGPSSLWPAPGIDLATYQPDAVIHGPDGAEDNPNGAGDLLGSRLVIGDVVGDATEDLLIGAFGAAGPGNAHQAAGELFVLAGRAAWPATIDLRSEAADLRVYNAIAGSSLGTPLLADWDGDGVIDLLVGAYGFPGSLEGVIYGLRGRAGLSGIRDLRNQPAEFEVTIPGRHAGLGYWMRYGDIDGDGFADVCSGSFEDDTPFSRRAAGAVVVVSGCESPSSPRDLIVEPPELGVYGAARLDWIGGQFDLADFDRDGFVDIVTVARGSDGVGGLRPDAGAVHVLRGQPNAPVCTVSAEAGAGQGSCGPGDVVLDGSASLVASCNGTPQYRWLRLGTGPGTDEVVSDWSDDPTAVIVLAATATLRLEVRCGDCAGPCTGSDTTTVDVDPALVPADLGNTLLCARVGSDVELRWAATTLAASYSLFRSESKGAWAGPIESGLLVVASTRADVPGPPKLYFYRAAAANCAGTHGP